MTALDPDAFPGLSPEPAAPAHPAWRRGLAPWLGGVLAGAVIIALGALYESAVTTDLPLDNAVILLALENEDADGSDPRKPPEGLAALVADGDGFPVTLFALPPGEHAIPDDGPFAPLAEMMPRRWVSVFGEAAAEALRPALESLLAEGSLPAAGDTAFLAGPGAGDEAAYLGGERYAVAGTLGRNAGVFHGQYIRLGPLPEEAIADLRETREGFFVLDRAALRDAVPEEDREHFTLTTGIHFAPGPTIALSILGLLIVALTGSVAWIRLFWNLAGRGGRFLRPAFDAFRAESALFIQSHAILYGIFFAMMLLGLVFTDTYVAALAFVRDIFTTGELQDIGEAYESGNILAAKFQTWRHNFLMATVLFAALPSLIIPGAAMIKNALSFSLLGFVMVPVLADSAFVMSFHSITMWLELEAYILVSFAALLIPVKVLRAFAQPGGDPGKAYLDGIAVLGSTTLLAGIILLFAALYEATTLILLR